MKKILYAVTIALIFLSSCSKTSTLPQAPGNTGGGTTDTITPPPPVVTGLKPQLSGLLYRDNIPTNVSSSYQSELDGFVVRATWKQLQPVAGGPIAPNIIDTAITYARQWNVAHPQQPWHIKIRLYSGALAPDWVKAQFGSVYLKDRVDSLIGSDNQVVKFWAPGFLNAYADLINKMAAKYCRI